MSGPDDEPPPEENQAGAVPIFVRRSSHYQEYPEGMSRDEWLEDNMPGIFSNATFEERVRMESYYSFGFETPKGAGNVDVADARSKFFDAAGYPESMFDWAGWRTARGYKSNDEQDNQQRVEELQDIAEVQQDALRDLEPPSK